eukprot:TRINITY_DN2073_c0_g1_i1.p1 TRINITY_DN2073_c0_g1~~TRINITY_DN2073_c0_g1_i1.p1  ORF type:complete len:291 (+),score=111.68 TRINITY_DN2073_c0_g1_i1:101-874(+)
MDELKEIMKDWDHLEISDQTFRRYLVANKFNADDAADQLLESLQWREDNNPDGVLFEDVEDKYNKGIVMIHKTDKRGHPCILFFASRHVKGETPVEELLKLAFYLIEKAIKELEDPVEQFTVIYDRRGFGKENLDFPMLKALFKTLSDHYPERLNRLYVLHANWLFHKAFAIVKRFLDPKTASKFKVLKQVDDLKEYFDDDCLLIEHNGESPAHEEFCEKLGLDPLPDADGTVNAKEEDLDLDEMAKEELEEEDKEK